ncbi:MAG: D-2-hydroxyacid dehydrogenase [Hyphomicrobiaceae bacterium]|nr:D-2-hydroxyacid dehydrogenase [Hyphomicrobiaceae bacterium]
MAERFTLRGTGISHVEVRDKAGLAAGIAEADVLLVSGLWSNDLLERAPRLRYVQSISAGIDQYDQDLFRSRGVRLANAKGVNANAVSEHAMSLILALARQLHTGRDNQARKHWRGMISDISQREDELGGKTLLIVGLGAIGNRLARLARAFDLKVVATRRDPSRGKGDADAVHSDRDLAKLLPQADIVALTCPLTPDTENLVNAETLACMKPGAHLVNVARGRVVDEPALIAALQAGRLTAAALDCTVEEPLPASSPLWAMENVIITPHTAGETRRYEDNVLDILMANLERIWRGETNLVNEIV